MFTNLLFTFAYYLTVCVPTGGVYEYRGSLAGVSSLLPALGLRDLTHAAGLGSKHLYSLSHLTGLKKQLLRIPLGKVEGPVPGDPAGMEGRGREAGLE